MIKSFTFVKRRANLTRDQFFKRWCEHTREWDLRDHADCTLNRLILITEDASPFDGLAETHWPSQNALNAAIAFYGTEEGKKHWADLQSFMDIDNSPTVSAEFEAEVSILKGIQIISSPGLTRVPGHV
jgi:hypothetical protein